MKSKHLLKCIVTATAFCSAGTVLNAQNKLAGRAVAPAATFQGGPISGKYIKPQVTTNGQPVPFAAQPFQGISALIDNKDGSFMAMPDNGYGGMENSADFYLRLYKIKPELKTAAGGSGAVQIVSYIEFNDKNNKIPFAIANHFTADRKLTGADFDIESIQRAADSTYWVGDEFGPFLLHFDKNGTLLESPYEIPDFDNPGKYIRSPQSQMNEEGSAVRLMNAYRTHAQMHGNMKAPVFSPNASLIDDNNLATEPGRAAAGVHPVANAEIFNVTSIKNAGYPVVAWTVNDSATMVKLLQLGVNGIISDNPSLLYRTVKAVRPDYMDAADTNLIDPLKFDAQGHRGGRDLRPENTLPAMEIALDSFMTTLELDNGITKDSVPVLGHDPYIFYLNARKSNGMPYADSNEVLIKDLTLTEIQSMFISDKLRSTEPARRRQRNDTTLSPVSVAFTKLSNLKTYVIPSLENVFDFVNFYVEYYKTGAGATHPDAEKRWKNAERVRFNVETKFNPRTDTDTNGHVFVGRTVDAASMARKVARVIIAKGMTQRADIQSFAHQTLLTVQEEFPEIRTVYLFTDSPIVRGANGKAANANDGGNLEPQNGTNSPWLGGLYWPYRSTKVSNPARAQRSGGLEGMAISVDKTKLYPLLELALLDNNGKIPDSLTILAHEFNLASKDFTTGKRLKYKFVGTRHSIGDFTMYNQTNGLIIERDNKSGPKAAFKKVFRVTMNNTTDTLKKTEVLDLLNIQDNNNLSSGLGTLPNDYGVGTTFRFPYQTIESVVVVDSANLILINDNNYPFTVSRHNNNTDTTSDDIVDDNEMIMVSLEPANYLGKVLITGMEEVSESSSLLNNIRNYPNPFSSLTTLSITLAQPTEVTISISNMMGETVESIHLGNMSSGFHSIELKNSASLKSGVYSIKMKAGDKESFTRAIKAD